MDQDTLKRIKIAGVLLLMPAAAIILTITGIHSPTRGPRSASPNIDGLKGVLERSANASMPAPQVTNEKVILIVPKDGVAAETQKIIALASAAGGTAMKSTTPAGEPEVLASVPAEAAAKFVETATGKPNTLLISVRPGESELIDVVITSSAVSAPTP